MPELFFIGATGHVGGAILDAVCTSHPEIRVTAQARTEDLAVKLVAKYPNITTHIGNLGNLTASDEAIRRADIVINTAPDITHDDEIKTLLSSVKDGAYYIHTAGASLIWDEPKGSPDAKTWDDIADIEALTNPAPNQVHASTDNLVRTFHPRLHIAIMSPTWFSGLSPSIAHPAPLSHPGFILAAKAIGSGFEIGSGANRACYIDVLDLAAQYMVLLSDALATLSGQPIVREGVDWKLWGPQAYYFGEGEEMSHREFMRGIVPSLYKASVIRSEEIKSAGVDEVVRMSLYGPDAGEDAPPPPADSWAFHIAIGAGVNMRVRASRMRALGWVPRQKGVLGSWEGTLECILKRMKAEEK